MMPFSSITIMASRHGIENGLHVRFPRERGGGAVRLLGADGVEVASAERCSDPDDGENRRADELSRTPKIHNGTDGEGREQRQSGREKPRSQPSSATCEQHGRNKEQET